MKSSHKSFLISIALIIVLGAAAYFVLVGPKASSAKSDIKYVQSKEKDLKKLAGNNGMLYEDIKKLLDDRQAELFMVQNERVATLSFSVDERFDVSKRSGPELDFPILRNEIVAAIQEDYPGFPFDTKFGFPELVKGDIEQFRDKYIRLAICERILQVFGEAGVDSLMDIEHPTEIAVREEAAKMTIVRKVVGFKVEGRLTAILDAVRLLSTPGRYLRVESFNLTTSKSGYSHGCSISVSMIIVKFDAGTEEVTPTETPAPDLSIAPTIPVIQPTTTPVIAPMPSSTPEKTAPKVSRAPFGL